MTIHNPNFNCNPNPNTWAKSNPLIEMLCLSLIREMSQIEIKQCGAQEKYCPCSLVEEFLF